MKNSFNYLILGFFCFFNINSQNNIESLSIGSELISAIEALNIEEVKQIIAGRVFNSEAEKQQILKFVEEQEDKVRAPVLEFVKKYKIHFLFSQVLINICAVYLWNRIEHRKLKNDFSIETRLVRTPGKTEQANLAALNGLGKAHKALQDYNNQNWLNKYGKKHFIAFWYNLGFWTCVANIGTTFFIEPKIEKLEAIKKLIQEIPVSRF